MNSFEQLLKCSFVKMMSNSKDRQSDCCDALEVSAQMRRDDKGRGSDVTSLKGVRGFAGRFLKRLLKYYTPRLGTALIGFALFVVGYGFQVLGEPHLGLPSAVKSSHIYLYFLAYVFSGYYLFLSAVRGLRKWRLSYPFLMVAAGASAFALGSYAEGAAILILMTLGEWLEEVAGRRVKDSLYKLYNEIPKEVTLVNGGDERRVPLSAIEVGDTVLIRAGEVVPVDGEIVGGSASLDVSSVKGEFIPEYARIGAKVMAGSVNLDGVLKISAKSSYAESTVSRLYRAIEDALRQKGSYTRFFERFSQVYTPIVVLIAISFGFGSYYLLGWEGDKAIYSSLVFLVVSCPCAFVLSTPIATAAAMAGSARRGILIRGSSALERLSSVKALALDKTGTLTERNLTLQSLLVAEGFNESDVLSYAMDLEESSNHPIAGAIRDFARRRQIKRDGQRVTGIRYQVGGGAEGRLGSKHICIGSVEFVGNHHKFSQIQLTPESSLGNIPHAVMFVDEKPVASFFFGEKLRKGASDLSDKFSALGLKSVVILSGDRREKVEELAKEIGIEHFYSELSPDEKLAHLRELRQKVGPTAMVGDGINDSPVLAGADVGIAMNTVGNDMVLGSADVVVANESLFTIPGIFRLSRTAIRTIQQNTIFALIGKFAFAGLALYLSSMGHNSLWLAVLGDDGLTLLVIINSMRLLKFPAPRN